MALEQGRFSANESLSEKFLAHHKEKHFTAGEIVRDIIIGVSDGLTVPFALAAGLSGPAAPSSLILTAGLAEVAAGAIAMGLGGYLAAKSEADHYWREYKREQEEIVSVPDTEAAEVCVILAEYDLQPHEYAPPSYRAPQESSSLAGIYDEVSWTLNFQAVEMVADVAW